VAPDKPVVIGRTSSPWGVKGWIKVISFTETVEDILTYPVWTLRGPRKELQLELEAGKRHGKGVIAKFKGFDTPEHVRELAGLEVVIHRSALPETGKNEYYWTDLEGLTVIDQHGKPLGTVQYLIETGANDCMVIQASEGGQIAIPWLLGSVVTRVSLETGEIFVDWDPI